LVYEMGLTHVNTMAVGAGVAGGLGIGGAATSGHHVTAIAARAAPPRPKSIAGAIITAIVSFFIGFAFPWLWILTGLATLGAIVAFFENQTEYPKQLDHWRQLYLCERCGEIGIPALQPAVRVSASRAELPRTTRAPLPPTHADVEDGAQKLCVYCRSYIPTEATVCRYCQRDVQPASGEPPCLPPAVRRRKAHQPRSTHQPRSRREE